MKKRTRWIIPFIIFLLFLGLFLTRSTLLGYIFARQQKYDNAVSVINLVCMVITFAITVYDFITRDQVPLKSPIKQTCADQLIDHIKPKPVEGFPWIDRQVVTTSDLRAHRLLVISGGMKSGKNSEAVELLRQAEREGICSPICMYDIGVDRMLPEELKVYLERSLDPGASVLFFLDQFPLEPCTRTQIEALDIFMQAVKKREGHFVATLREDLVNRDPLLQNWLAKNNAGIYSIKPLRPEQKLELVDRLSRHWKINLDEDTRKVLIEQSDSYSPYHLILIFQKMNQDRLTPEEIQKLASMKSNDIWTDIRTKLAEKEPATESLLKALAIFHHAGVTPQVDLVHELAVRIERERSHSLSARRVHRKILLAANMLSPYGIEAHSSYNFSDVAVESLSNPAEARRRLEIFFVPTSWIHSPFKQYTNEKVDAMLDLAAAAYYQGDLDTAIRVLTAVTKTGHKKAQAWSNLGVLLKEQGHTDEAKQAFLKAVAADPKYAPAWYNLGLLLKEQGCTDEAKQAYQKAVAAAPNLALAWYYLGLLLEEQGFKDKAELAYKKATVANPKYADAWFNLGVLLVEQNRKGEAAQYFRLTVAVDPNYAKGWYNLGILFIEQGLKEEATQAFRQTVITDNKISEAWSNLGMLLRRDQSWDEARTALEQAVRLSPEKASNHASLAAVYRELGLEAQARQELAEAQRLSLNTSPYNRACIAALCADIETALSLLEETLTKHETSVDFVRKDPDWKEWVSDPRFVAVLDKFGRE